MVQMSQGNLGRVTQEEGSTHWKMTDWEGYSRLAECCRSGS